MEKKKCLKCFHEWIGRVDNPRDCPNCKTTYWNRDEYSRCEVCNKNILSIIKHHKDGNHSNNDPENVINLCRHCHLSVHIGIKEKKDKMRTTIKGYLKKPEIKEKLNELREYWLKNKKKQYK